MSKFRKGLWRSAIAAATVAGFVTSAAAQMELKIMAPAAPGGGEALAAILGGKVTAGISGYGEFESQVKAGKLRLIGLTSATKTANVDVPSIKEQGIDLEIANWRAVVAPPGISADQKKALTEAVDKLVKSKEWQEILKAKGWEDAYVSGDAFAKVLADEQSRTKEVLTAVGLVKS